MDVNVIHSPSGLQLECRSSRRCRVSRIARPPSAEARQRSPPQLKTISEPSGLIDGKRGRATVLESAETVSSNANSRMPAIASIANQLHATDFPGGSDLAILTPPAI